MREVGVISKLSRNELLVLAKLRSNYCVNKLKASTIRKISDGMDISYFTVRNLLKALSYAGFCEMGCDNGNAHTYYITEKGLQILENIKGDL